MIKSLLRGAGVVAVGAALFTMTATAASADTPYRGEDGSLQFSIDTTGYAAPYEGHFLSPVANPPTQYPTADATGADASSVSQTVYLNTGQSNDFTAAPGHEAYCIEFNQDIYPGSGAQQGTPAKSGVANLGYAARIVQEFGPGHGQPAASYFADYPEKTNSRTNDPVTIDDLRGDATQLAIWYFTDGVVMDDPATIPPTKPGNALRPAVAYIVNTVLSQGPLPSTQQPPVPTLRITPSEAQAQVGKIAGPFTVTGTHGINGGTLNSTDGTLYADAAGTRPIKNGTFLASGATFYLRSSSATAHVSVTGTGTALPGAVLVYDGKTANLPNGQALMLASTQVRTASDAASAKFMKTTTPTPSNSSPRGTTGNSTSTSASSNAGGGGTTPSGGTGQNAGSSGLADTGTAHMTALLTGAFVLLLTGGLAVTFGRARRGRARHS